MRDRFRFSWAIRAALSVALLALAPPASASALSAPAPSAPANLVATPGDAVVHLSWEPAQTSGAPVVAYKIYRYVSDRATPSPGYAGQLLTTVDGLTTSYSDRSVTNGERYHYSVSAVDAFDEGPRSNSAMAMPEDPNLPSAPTLRIDRVEYVGGGMHESARVYLSWTPGASDGGAPLAEYRVYWFDDVIATVRSSQTGYVHRTGALDNEYRVTAINVHGEESAFSNRVGIIACTPRRCP